MVFCPAGRNRCRSCDATVPSIWHAARELHQFTSAKQRTVGTLLTTKSIPNVLLQGTDFRDRFPDKASLRMAGFDTARDSLQFLSRMITDHTSMSNSPNQRARGTAPESTTRPAPLPLTKGSSRTRHLSLILTGCTALAVLVVVWWLNHAEIRRRGHG